MTNPSYPDALPALSRLHWYVIERVLGQGGFGITYLARDTNLDQTVAIKEYLPVEVATRMTDGTIRSRTDDLRDRYRLGLERFIQEARTLARFDHPNIVRVLSVFEFNGTAYMVMRFEKGGTLAALLDRRGTLPAAELLQIITPILNGLELVHNEGFIHRDIKPDNIHIGDNGNPVLLDFGSARQALGSAHTLTILVAPGYAPFEQYYSDSASQGPWTDIYGLGATCYRAIAARPPLDAVSRSKGILGNTQDVLVPASVVGAGRYSGALLAAVDHALAFAEKDRPQSIAQWRDELIQGRTDLQREKRATPAARSAQPAAPREATNAAITSGASATAHAKPAAVARTMVIALIGAAIGVIAVAAYVVAQKSAELSGENEALKHQLAERKSAEASAAGSKEQVAKESSARAPSEPPIPETRTVEVARVDEPKPAPLTARRTPPEPTRGDELKRPDSKPKLALATRASTASTRAIASSVPLVEADKKSSASETPSEPTPALDAPDKKPVPTPAEQIADADRAIAAKSYDDALAALKPLAETGNAQAQRRLGTMSADGLGATRDYAVAQGWFEKAALQGDVEAQLKLGAMYENGPGLARNNNLAYMWYGIAAGLGSSVGKSGQQRVLSTLQPAERAQADKSIESNLGRMKKR